MPISGLWFEAATTLVIKVIERKTPIVCVCVWGEGNKKIGNRKPITPLCGLEFIHIIDELWTTFILLWPYTRQDQASGRDSPVCFKPLG